jgi:membrane protease YdiL (CAAX protease family)
MCKSESKIIFSSLIINVLLVLFVVLQSVNSKDFKKQVIPVAIFTAILVILSIYENFMIREYVLEYLSY